jgi:peroxiredoxin/outer membrane lipoprotein-sorting protein
VIAFLAAAATVRAAPPSASSILRRVGYVYGHLNDYHIAAMRESFFQQSHSGFSRHSDISLDGDRQGRARMELTGDEPDVLVVSDGKSTWQYAPVKNQYTQRAGPALRDGSGAQGPVGSNEDVFQQAYELLVGRFTELPQLEKNATLEGQERIEFKGQQILCYRIAIRFENMTDQLWINRSSFLVLKEKRTQDPASSGSRTLVDDEIRVREISTRAARPPDLFTFAPPANAWRVVALELPSEGQGVEGTSAGNFTLSDIEGNGVRLSDFRGKVVLLSFWATWCAPCKRELPVLQKIFEERKDLEILTVDDESPANIRHFLQENHYDFPALIDQDRTLFKRFAVHFIPTVLVIDQEGVIVHEIVGWEGPQKLLAALDAVGSKEAGPRGSGISGANLLHR